MSFPVHTGSGSYVISDSSVIRGKQTALDAQTLLDEVSTSVSPTTPSPPKGYKGPVCPKCGDYRLRVLSAGSTEAAEFTEPTHRAATKALGRPILKLPNRLVCPCGNRFVV